MADDAFQAYEAALRDDWGFDHLLQALALGEGFRFHLLTAETPRAAAAAFRLLEVEAGGSLEILRPDPARWNVRDPVSFQELAESILTQLLALGEKPPRVVLIDASDAVERDEPAWREVFRRMNERRNGITGRLPCALVLCVPPRLAVAFAQEAPDFWSIRSTSVTLPPLVVEVGLLAPGQEEGPPQQERGVWWIAPNQERLQVELDEARRQVIASPGNASYQAALAIHLRRLGRHEEERGSLDWAEEAYREVLSLWKTLTTQAMGLLESRREVAVSLVDIGDVYRARGSLDRALESYEESIWIIRHLLSQEPDRPEWLRDLSVGQEKVGDVQRARGSLDRALESYEESIWIIRHLLSHEPDRPEWLRDLSVGLNKVGDVQRARGSLDRALESYEESLGIIRRLLSYEPDRPDWRRDLSVSLVRVGDIQRARGSLDRALETYEESLGIIRRLLSHDPDRPDWRRDLSVILVRIGDIHRARGSWDRALEAYEESLELRRGLVSQDRNRPEWLRDLIVNCERRATLTEVIGNTGWAIADYDEAIRLAQEFKERFPEYPPDLNEFWPKRIKALRFKLDELSS